MEIAKITPLYPDLIVKGYEKKVEEQYEQLQKIQEALYQARDLVFELEGALKEEQEKWDQIQTMFKIEFEKEDSESNEPKGDPNIADTLGIINHSDYRNKNV